MLCNVHALAFTLALGAGLVEARVPDPSTPPPLAVVGVGSPRTIAGNVPGLFATFSDLPPPSGKLDAWSPGADEDVQGCADKLSFHDSGVAVLRQGTCTFVAKALHAQRAGARGVIIVSDQDKILEMGIGNTTQDEEQAAAVTIFALSVAKSPGEQIISALHSHEAVDVTIQVYAPSLFDPSEAFVILLATTLVIAGACFSTADLRAGSPIAPRREDVVEVTNDSAIGFFILGSIMLVVLFYFMKYMIYFIICAFCLGGFSCIHQIVSLSMQFAWPVPMRQRVGSLPLVGPVTWADLFAVIPAACIVTSWLCFRNTATGWLFQDIMGAGFLCWMQRTMRLPDMKVATLFLTIMFFFDIFWVFISPRIYGKSVMVEVASGGDTGESVPMLLRVPAINDPLGHDRMLGFGDVALPGLLVSYLRRYDVLGKRSLLKGFFMPSVVGYFTGLILTMIALTIMRMGQPALLYLVPCTLGLTTVLGFCRGELGDLWEGGPKSIAGRVDGCAVEGDTPSQAELEGKA